MALTNRAILDVVVIIYYSPTLLLAAWLLKKHGFSRQMGWLYLVLLALLRLIGGGTGIAAAQNPSEGLVETTDICWSIGISPLFLAWLGIIGRVNDGMHNYQVPKRILQLMPLPIVVGLILGIVGGTKQFDTNPSSRSEGQDFTEAAIILYLVSLIMLTVVTVFIFTRIGRVLETDRRLLFAALASIPFLFVRIIYSLIADFDHGSSIFSIISTRDAAVVVQAIMSVLMEFIVVALYITAGLTTAALPNGNIKSEGVGMVQQEPSQVPYGRIQPNQRAADFT